MKQKKITKKIACIFTSVLSLMTFGSNVFSIVDYSAGESGLVNNDTTPYKVNIVSGGKTVAVVPIGIGLRGDANGSGKVDVLDAVKIAAYQLGKIEDGYDNTLGAAMADVNMNNKIDILDAVAVARYILVSGTHEEKWEKVYSEIN